LVVKALITLPNDVNDRFIFLASSRVSPSAPVLDIFSEPARSIKLRTPFFSDPSENLYLISIIKIVWALDEQAFIFVLAMDLWFYPISNRSIDS